MKLIKGKMMNLVTLSHLYIVFIIWMHRVGTAYGDTLSPPWLTLSGCFNYSNINTTSSIQNNEPTQCFENCPSFQIVGLKNVSCICIPLNNSNEIRINRLCNLPCPGKSEVYCGAEGVGNELMSVYARGKPLPDDTSGRNSYGYGYVVISGGIKHFHASGDNTSLQNGYLCYNDYDPHGPKPCIWKTTVITWKEANDECNSRSARLIAAAEIDNCAAGVTLAGTFWIGMYKERPGISTSTTKSSTASETTIVTTTTANSTSTTSGTSTSITPTSLAPASSFQTTTGSTPNHFANTTVIDKTAKPTSSDGISAGLIAALVAVIVVAILVVLVSILFCKKRKRLCFKERPQSGNMCKSNTTSQQDIPGLGGTIDTFNVPPGSTLPPIQNGWLTTGMNRGIQNGQYNEMVQRTEMPYSIMGEKTQNLSERSHKEMNDKMQSDKKRKKKRNKQAKADQHLASDALYGKTGHQNGAFQSNEAKPKNQHGKEYSYQNNETNNTSSGPGSDFVSLAQNIGTPTKVNVLGKIPDEPNYKIQHNQIEENEQHDIMREPQMGNLPNGFNSIFSTPVGTPFLEKRTDLSKKYKKRKERDSQMDTDDKPEQEYIDLNEGDKEQTDSKTDSQNEKKKKKKRKRSRERSNKKVLNEHDEIGDVPATMSDLTQQTDIQSKQSRKKKKKRKEKKDKETDVGNTAEQGLNLKTDDEDQMFNAKIPPL